MKLLCEWDEDAIDEEDRSLTTVERDGVYSGETVELTAFPGDTEEEGETFVARGETVSREFP